MKGVRIDLRCVELGLAETRQKAQALIRAGAVLVDERPVTKPGTAVPPDAAVRLRRRGPDYVSRGGHKLAAALDAFDIDPTGLVCLDAGASTGGFTDCLLRRGAAHVVAVDVGYGQLAWKLRQDPAVTVLERTNIRHLTPEALGEHRPAGLPWPPALVTADLSFISLALVLPGLARLAAPGALLVALVKPQFEAGRGQVGKGGVVRDPAARLAAIDRACAAATEAGYALLGGVDSPLPGPRGNVEYLMVCRTPAPDAKGSPPCASS